MNRSNQYLILLYGSLILLGLLGYVFEFKVFMISLYALAGSVMLIVMEKFYGLFSRREVSEQSRKYISFMFYLSVASLILAIVFYVGESGITLPGTALAVAVYCYQFVLLRSR